MKRERVGGEESREKGKNIWVLEKKRWKQRMLGGVGFGGEWKRKKNGKNRKVEAEKEEEDVREEDKPKREKVAAGVLAGEGGGRRS